MVASQLLKLVSSGIRVHARMHRMHSHVPSTNQVLISLGCLCLTLPHHFLQVFNEQHQVQAAWPFGLPGCLGLRLCISVCSSSGVEWQHSRSTAGSFPLGYVPLPPSQPQPPADGISLFAVCCISLCEASSHKSCVCCREHMAILVRQCVHCGLSRLDIR